MAKFQNKYRIESIRAQWWDYGWNGAYFITICTHNRQHFFGKIIKGKMELSDMGLIADTLWHEIPNKFKYAELGDFVVMPNHIHGILILDKPERLVDGLEATRLIASPPSPEKIPGGFAGTKNPMINENVSRIIRWYKGRCSYEIRKTFADFAWQSLFHDRIIRDAAAYQRISNYIIKNPENWKGDNFISG